MTAPADLNPVHHFVLACLRGCAGGEEPARNGEVALDWDKVAGYAAEQGVAALLFRRLASPTDCCHAPFDVKRTFLTAYLANQVRNTRLYKDLNCVLLALQDQNIPVVVLKGAHLAQLVFGDIGLRTMSDIDLLIHKQDLAHAEAILRHMDYIPPQGQDRAWYEAYHFHYKYILPRKAADVELHWRLELIDESAGQELDALWQRTQIATLAGVETRVLAPEDLLLHVCAHISRHIFDYFPLRGLCDVAEIVSHFEQLDWSAVCARAERWRIGPQVFLPLLLAQDLLSAAVPDDVLQALRPDEMDPRLPAWARERVLTDAVLRSDPAAEVFSDTFGLLWTSRSLGERLAALGRAFFPPTRSLAQAYGLPPGSRRVYLYYPVRIKDLIQRHGARGCRLLRGQHDEVDWMGREGRRVALTEYVRSRPAAKP